MKHICIWKREREFRSCCFCRVGEGENCLRPGDRGGVLVVESCLRGKLFVKHVCIWKREREFRSCCFCRVGGGGNLFEAWGAG